MGEIKPSSPRIVPVNARINVKGNDQSPNSLCWSVSNKRQLRLGRSMTNSLRHLI